MGVKNLKKFIELNFPESIVTDYLTNLKGFSIAVDTPCFLYDFKRRSILQKENWLKLITDFLIKMKRFEIKLLFIFEGKSPNQKLHKIKQRKEIKKKNQIKNQEIINSIMYYLKSKEINKNLLKLWNKIKRQNKNLLSEDCNFDINKIIEFVSYNSPLFLTKTDYNNFLNILNKFNVIFIKQNFEAETWCCYLKYLGSVNDVYSKDTDVILYSGINRCIIDISENTYTFIDKLKLLKLLKMNNETFLDFCILVGNDYSSEKTKIYIFKAFELFTKYKTLENIYVKGLIDKKKLNISWQKKFFNYEFIS